MPWRLLTQKHFAMPLGFSAQRTGRSDRARRIRVRRWGREGAHARQSRLSGANLKISLLLVLSFMSPFINRRVLYLRALSTGFRVERETVQQGRREFESPRARGRSVDRSVGWAGGRAGERASGREAGRSVGRLAACPTH